jgi:hypothetical protein
MCEQIKPNELSSPQEEEYTERKEKERGKGKRNSE